MAPRPKSWDASWITSPVVGWGNIVLLISVSVKPFAIAVVNIVIRFDASGPIIEPPIIIFVSL